MIHQIVIQHVAADKRDEYLRVFGEFLRNARYEGSHGIRLFAGVEDPARVILMIEWDSVESHTRHRGTAMHDAMKELTSQYQTEKSDGAHYLLHEVKT